MENINRASLHSRWRQPGPLDSPLAGRLLKRHQVYDSAFFRDYESSQFHVLFLPSRCFHAFLVPRDRVYPGEDIARERVAHRARRCTLL